MRNLNKNKVYKKIKQAALASSIRMTVTSSSKKVLSGELEKEVAVGCWRSYNGFTALFTGYLERVFYRLIDI